MIKLNLKLLGLSLLAGALTSTSALAATVGAGTFNLSGTAVGTTGGIDFYLTSPGDQMGSINLPTSGVFADLAPTTVEMIQNLTSGNGVTPGTTFDFMNWIQLTDGINLDATNIPIPSFPVCTGGEAIGTSCLVNAASPVILTQTDTGVAARINIFGDAHYAGQTTETPFTGLFTSPTTNFNTITDFESYFNTHGALPALSYSASFTTPAVSAVPEPAAFGLAGLGLLGVGLLRRRKKISQ
jgi:hypothetical protein